MVIVDVLKAVCILQTGEALDVAEIVDIVDVVDVANAQDVLRSPTHNENGMPFAK